ncbi:MAG TPA: hypothetical protein VMW17_12080 [Candidatus Binatia bacterium]|nr:hypothetical protein [Candidatus Binatia bacterium]
MFCQRIQRRLQLWWGESPSVAARLAEGPRVQRICPDTPGKGRLFTRFADEVFEQLWRETFPDSI